MAFQAEVSSSLVYERMIWDFGCLGFRGLHLTSSAPVRRLLAKNSPCSSISIAAQNLLNFMCSHLSKFPNYFLSSFLKSFASAYFLEVFLLFLPRQFQSFRTYIKVFEIFWIFFVQCESYVHSSSHGYLIFPGQYLEEVAISPRGYRDVGLFPVLCSISQVCLGVSTISICYWGTVAEFRIVHCILRALLIWLRIEIFRVLCIIVRIFFYFCEILMRTAING